jgi:hypothetical protein
MQVFTSAGLLGQQLEERAAQAEAKAAAKKGGYTEGDQEDLFNSTHEGKSTGKKGLGRGKSIANLGNEFTGTRVNFDAPTEAPEGSGRAEAEVEALKWKKEIRRALEAAQGVLSLKKLQKAVVAAMEGKTSAAPKVLKAAFKEKVQGSSMFLVHQGSVSLVSSS